MNTKIKMNTTYEQLKMSEYLSGQKTFMQLSNHDKLGYYKFIGDEGSDIFLFDVFALIAQIITKR